MHSSRMRTTRFSDRVGWGRGRYLPRWRGVGDVCLGGVSVHGRGVCLVEVSASAQGGGCLGGGVVCPGVSAWGVSA